MTSKKKKSVFRRIERIKIIEYGCIGLVILLFLGLAIVYGGQRSADRSAEADASPSPVPTADTSIRGMNVLNALTAASFEVTYQQEHYDVCSPDGVAFEMQMQSDDKGIVALSFETLLYADPEDGTETSSLIATENKQTVNALRTLLDAIMPVFHRTITDSDTITAQCQKVVRSGEPYSKHFGTYSIRITSDPDADLQTVKIQFIRDDS